jgi:hypothetical protein
MYRRKLITYRQRQYLQSRTTERKRVVKHEQSIQVELCDWFKQVLPGEHFISDTGSGAFNSNYEKERHNRQQSHKHEPDIKILASRRGYHALLIKLKADCPHTPKHFDCMIKMRRDGRTIRVYKDKKGRIIERDYKIRKKGDWISLHVERQAATLEDYNAKGFLARFGLGLEHAKKLIRWYFDLPDDDTQELF